MEERPICRIRIWSSPSHESKPSNKSQLGIIEERLESTQIPTTKHNGRIGQGTIGSVDISSWEIGWQAVKWLQRAAYSAAGGAEAASHDPGRNSRNDESQRIAWYVSARIESCAHQLDPHDWFRLSMACCSSASPYCFCSTSNWTSRHCHFKKEVTGYEYRLCRCQRCTNRSR